MAARELAEKTCTPCRGGVPPLTSKEAESYHEQAPAWELLDENKRILRTYRFANFQEASPVTRNLVPMERNALERTRFGPIGVA